MEVIEFISQYGAWSWIIAGLVLLAIELVAPGGIFVWFGVAAIVTGLATLIQNFGWPFQWAIFGVLSVVGIVAWLRFRRNKPEETDRPFLNKRSDKLIGTVGFLSEPISGGQGRMEIGESVWRVTGPDLPTGHRVRVVGHAGPVLEVESADPERTATA